MERKSDHLGGILKDVVHSGTMPQWNAFIIMTADTLAGIPIRFAFRDNGSRLSLRPLVREGWGFTAYGVTNRYLYDGPYLIYE